MFCGKCSESFPHQIYTERLLKESNSWWSLYLELLKNPKPIHLITHQSSPVFFFFQMSELFTIIEKDKIRGERGNSIGRIREKRGQECVTSVTATKRLQLRPIKPGWIKKGGKQTEMVSFRCKCGKIRRRVRSHYFLLKKNVVVERIRPRTELQQCVKLNPTFILTFTTGTVKIVLFTFFFFYTSIKRKLKIHFIYFIFRLLRNEYNILDVHL